MKVATNTSTGYRIERLLSQGGIPLNTVVKLYGTVSCFLSGKDVVIKGYYSNVQGYILTVDTATRNGMAVQVYGKTGIATYIDQEDADQDFSAKQAEYRAAFTSQDWAACKSLTEMNG